MQKSVFHHVPDRSGGQTAYQKIRFEPNNLLICVNIAYRRVQSTFFRQRGQFQHSRLGECINFDHMHGNFLLKIGPNIQN